jgi:hypothetical protein
MIFTLLGACLVLNSAFVGRASAVAPTVSIDPNPDAGLTSIHVSGTVDPGDHDNQVYIEYGTEEAGSYSFTFIGSVPAGAGPTPVSGDVTGLHPGTKYFVRIGVENGVEPEVFSPAPNPAVTTEAVSEPTATIQAVTSITGTTAEFSGMVNPNAPQAEGATSPEEEEAYATTWWFRYSEDAGVSWHETNAQSLPAGNAAKSVNFRTTGLKPNTTYLVALVAENDGGSDESSEVAGHAARFTTLAEAPSISTLPGFADGESGFQLKGEVNPLGSQVTRCVFEVGPDQSYGSTLPCEQSPGAGQRGVIVEAKVVGLNAGSAYHYRITAESAAGSAHSADSIFVPLQAPPGAPCANEEIRAEQGSQFLPECRAYEQVSPTEKSYDVGSNINAATIDLKVAPDGERVTFSGRTPLPGSLDGGFLGLGANRGADGWTIDGLIGAPGPAQMGLGFPSADGVLVGTTPDQRTSVYYDYATPPFGALYILRADGTRQRIATSVAPLSTETCVPLSGGCPNQVWFEGISDDGRHVVFSSSHPLVAGLTANGNDVLYEWTDDGSNGGAGSIAVVNRTNQPSLSLLDPGPAELGSEGFGLDDRFGYTSGLRHAISSDGSRIFFQNPAPPSNNLGSAHLYLREHGAHTTEVSAPEAGGSAASEVKYLDASQDGSIVYFWANAALTVDGDPHGGIYKYTVTTGRLAFVAPTSSEAPMVQGYASEDGAQLLFEDEPNPGHRVTKLFSRGVVRDVLDGAIGNFTVDHMADYACATVNVTPSGRYFTFTSLNHVYRYDTLVGALTVVGANERGVPDSSAVPATFGVNTCDAVLDNPRSVASRTISADGSTIAFETAASLVPNDNNQRDDVYVWREGRVRLISTGSGESWLAGMDASGKNIYFVTAQALVPQDGDALRDIYDARIDGGFAAPVRSRCEGEGCQGAASDPPSAAVTGSASLYGPGNPRHKSHKHKKKHSKRRHARGKHRRKTAAKRRHATRHQKTHRHRGGASQRKSGPTRGEQ